MSTSPRLCWAQIHPEYSGPALARCPRHCHTITLVDTLGSSHSSLFTQISQTQLLPIRTHVLLGQNIVNTICGIPVVTCTDFEQMCISNIVFAPVQNTSRPFRWLNFVYWLKRQFFQPPTPTSFDIVYSQYVSHIVPGAGHYVINNICTLNIITSYPDNSVMLQLFSRSMWTHNCLCCWKEQWE